jgi:hypothetical protein
MTSTTKSPAALSDHARTPPATTIRALWSSPEGIANLCADIAVWENQQALLLIAERVRRKLDYPDPGWRPHDARDRHRAATRLNDARDQRVKTVNMSGGGLLGRDRKGRAGYGFFRESNAIKISGAFGDSSTRDNTPGGHGGGYGTFTTDPGPDAPKWVRAGALLDDIFDRAAGAAVLVAVIRAFAAEAGISWAEMVRSAKRKGIRKSRVPGTRTSAWTC